MEKMETVEIVETLRVKINRLHSCKNYWKQFMIIRGFLLSYNRFSLKFPHTHVDNLVLQKCRVMLNQTLNNFTNYTVDQQRYLSKYFIPTLQQTAQYVYERKKRLLFFLAAKGVCNDLRKYIVEFLY